MIFNCGGRVGVGFIPAAGAFCVAIERAPSCTARSKHGVSR